MSLFRQRWFWNAQARAMGLDAESRSIVARSATG
jgi:hypothetical protein